MPTHIETIVDRDGAEWFALDDQLCELLEFPADARCHQLLHQKERTFRVLEHSDGTREEVDLISEVGLYMLLLVSKAQAVQPFKSWVLEIVSPTLAEDGIYLMGEETLFHVPKDYVVTHDEIWSGDLDEASNAQDLATFHLPHLRQHGTAELTAYIIYTADGGTIWLSDFRGAFQSKNKRKRNHTEAA